MFSPALLWKAPEVNPLNNKARSIPVLNPINLYGRVFFFSWFGFFVAFWSWYAFPPLLSITIKKDLHLSTVDVANSNIVALCGTLLVRVIAGPMCDKVGPRWTFVATLFAGAIPTALAGTTNSVSGLIALRFFIGILGGSFVPCQVWSTGFFDKNIVGTANSLIGGWGNSGGGVTYFLMPAIYDSLHLDRHLSPHTAWRVAFIVPFIVIVFTGTAMLLLCPDTPTGRWSERHLAVQHLAEVNGIDQSAQKPSDGASGSVTPEKDEKTILDEPKPDVERGQMTTAPNEVDVAKGEVVVAPTLKEALRVLCSPQTLFQMLSYFCTFGSELAINSVLGAYYLSHFKSLGQTGTGNWAAMFGLLNVVTRPLGGAASDLLYRRTGSLWAKKFLITGCGLLAGVFILAIGLANPDNKSTMFGLVAGAAIFIEAGNGANFSLVPHVHPYANGIVSGFTGATGNFGGIIFAIIFRYHGKDYAKSLWIIGVIIIAINIALCWIRPVPKGQIGGR